MMEHWNDRNPFAAVIARFGGAPHGSGKIRYLRRAPAVVFLGGGAAALLFLAAMWCCPGPAYNPCLRMLSYLGRTKVNGVDYPACHYLFTSGLALSAGVVAWFYPALSCFVKGAWQKRWLLWGGAVNAAGLLTIALVPENVCGLFHNVGCWAAALGGGAVLLILTPKRNNPAVPARVRWGWVVWGLALSAVFCAFLACHAFKLLPFAPFVPTCQKALILTFVAWFISYAARLHLKIRRPGGRVAAVTAAEQGRRI